MTPPLIFHSDKPNPNTPRLHRAHALCDAQSIASAPNQTTRAAILVLGPPDDLRILAAGDETTVRAHPRAPEARVIDHQNAILIPAIVNAHAHLDLTHIGPQPDPDDFLAWIDMIREKRTFDPNSLAASVRQGIQLSRNAGVALIADIAGARQTIPTQVLRDQRMPSVSYLEVFGTGDRQADTIAFLDATADAERDQPQSPVRFAISPHATYSCGTSVYQHAAHLANTRNIPLTTHLAETPEEHQFIAHATGPLRTLLERLAVWDHATAASIGHGKHPVEHLAPILEQATILCAHVNDAPDHAIDILARTNTPVVYCPRASHYFRHHEHFGPHRYRDMIQAGILVVLGTDSIVNLPPDTNRLSTLDEARFLYQRDNTDPSLLLRMITTDAARALGADPDHFTLAHGPTAGILAVPIDGDLSIGPDPRIAVLRSSGGVEWAEAPHLEERTDSPAD